MSLLTLQYTLDKPPQYAIVLTFLAGCIELLMGVLRLGIMQRSFHMTTNEELLRIDSCFLKDSLWTSYQFR